MNYASINKNDMVNGEGVCVSFWTQGCPHRCPGCHNPETWDFNAGIETDFTFIIDEIIEAMQEQDIKRNLSILGGEPLCEENEMMVSFIVDRIKEQFKDRKIFIWTGYELEELQLKNSIFVNKILDNIDVLVTGRYIEAQRDISLKWRGSANQKILYKGIDF